MGGNKKKSQKNEQKEREAREAAGEKPNKAVDKAAAGQGTPPKGSDQVLLTKENQRVHPWCPCQKSTAAMCQVKGWNPLTSIPRTNLRGLFGGKPSHRVAVDWFNTTYLAGRGVPQCNKDALLKLSAHGFDLLLLSYCGWQRDQEVRAAAKALG